MEFKVERYPVLAEKVAKGCFVNTQPILDVRGNPSGHIQVTLWGAGKAPGSPPRRLSPSCADLDDLESWVAKQDALAAKRAAKREAYKAAGGNKALGEVRQCEFCRQFEWPDFTGMVVNITTRTNARPICALGHQLRNSDYGFRRRCGDFDEKSAEVIEALLKRWGGGEGRVAGAGQIAGAPVPAAEQTTNNPKEDA